MNVIVKYQQIRGYWITDLGQRVEEWVPAGVYMHGPYEDVNGITIGALVGGNGWSWHVPASIIDKLPRAQ